MRIEDVEYTVGGSRMVGHLVIDYHGDGKPLVRDEVMGRLGALMGDPDKIQQLGRAGLAILLDQPEVDPARVAAIGYCFGGTMALELARGGADLAVVVVSATLVFGSRGR